MSVPEWTLGDARLLPGGTRVQNLIAALLERAPVSGGAVAIVTPTGSFAHTFGRRGPHGEPTTLSDRYEIGSISKTIAALAAARLALAGKWRLDDPVRGILPWLELPAGAGEPTLAHLLTHTSGWIAGNDTMPGEIGQALELPRTRATTAPGEFFHYSNIGYVVLGIAIARVTAQPFHVAVRELVLEPLGIQGALTNVTGAERASIVPGTVPLRDDAPWSPGDPLAEASWVEPAGADGNIAASVAELAQFAAVLADPCRSPENEWLPGAVALLAAELAPSGEDILDVGRHIGVTEARYGLGVNVEFTADGTLLTHGGGMIGSGSFMIADSARKSAVAVVLSAPGERPYAELIARELHAGLAADPELGPGEWRSTEATADVAGRSVKSLVEGVEDPIAALAPSRPKLGRELFLDSRRGVNQSTHQESFAPFIGQYRSYSPWFSHFEIGIDPLNALVLRAYAGVESPTTDVPLVPLPGAPGCFRIGADPRLPETLKFGGIIDGVAQVADRDGCRYSRVSPR